MTEFLATWTKTLIRSYVVFIVLCGQTLPTSPLTLWMILTWSGAIMYCWCKHGRLVSYRYVFFNTILFHKNFINFKASGAWCTTYFLSDLNSWMWTHSCLINQCLSCIQPFTVIRGVVSAFVFSYLFLSTLYQIWNPAWLCNCNILVFPHTLWFPVQGITLVLGIQRNKRREENQIKNPQYFDVICVLCKAMQGNMVPIDHFHCHAM